MSINLKVTGVVVLCVLCFQASREVARSQANQTPAVVGVALDIPGVVKDGTKIERIKEGFNGLDDPIGLMDGTLVFSEPGARRIHRMDAKTHQSSVLVAESNESHGVTQDARDRLISVQAQDGSTRIGVIHPPGSEVVLADNFEGKPFSRPNDEAHGTTAWVGSTHSPTG
jgi:gluconolactonase